MRLVNVEEEQAQIAFALHAAEAFGANPRMHSFTGGDIAPGVLLALRWGLHDRAVLVLKLDESHVPTIYGDLVPRAA